MCAIDSEDVADASEVDDKLAGGSRTAAGEDAHPAAPRSSRSARRIRAGTEAWRVRFVPACARRYPNRWHAPCAAVDPFQDGFSTGQGGTGTDMGSGGGGGLLLELATVATVVLEGRHAEVALDGRTAPGGGLLTPDCAALTLPNTHCRASLGPQAH
jgi:hypothetical protein